MEAIQGSMCLAQGKPGFAEITLLFYDESKFTQKINGKSRTQAAEICSQRSLSGTKLLLQVWVLIPTLFSVQIPTKVEMEKRELCFYTH